MSGILQPFYRVPNLEKDLATLMDSLKEHEVYVYKEGRVLDARDSPVADVISTGLAALIHGSPQTPIADFNAMFDRLRKRYRLTPVSDLTEAYSELNVEAVTAVGTNANGNPNASSSANTVDEVNDGSDSQDSDSESNLDANEYLLVTSPTLPRVDEDDVALEMDEWDLDEEPEDDGDSEDEDVDEE
ncbi:hypothetical protein H0H93_008150 [Arthromyces matolae]|nr:hypothetical protein H0H93_008150 [Arthromyces matolae]